MRFRIQYLTDVTNGNSACRIVISGATTLEAAELHAWNGGRLAIREVGAHGFRIIDTTNAFCVASAQTFDGPKTLPSAAA